MLDSHIMKATICEEWAENSSTNENYKHQKCEVEDFAINACVSCLPAWLRFAQCLRQYRDNRKSHPYLTNAGKYATVFPTILFATLMNAYRDEYETFFKNPFLWCFICFKMISTIYGLAWDILGDFGLFKVCKKDRIFLREDVIYSKNFYYFLIIENCVLRFFWIFDFPMVALSYVNFRIMESISGLLEIIRYERLSSTYIYTIYVALVCVTFCQSLQNILQSLYLELCAAGKRTSIQCRPISCRS
ncbi:hypothetical protein GQX74_007236 [Glossina fuscipes]|nr:hypothetical protein GQX74_007236 [Glossina fuscipes]